MNTSDIRREEYFEGALRTLLAPESPGGLQPLLDDDRMDPDTLCEVLRKNLVLVRALGACDLSSSRSAEELAGRLNREQARIATGVEAIQRLGRRLSEADIRYAIIKTLDQYPDMGHDIDFLILDRAEEIVGIVANEFDGEVKDRSLSERMAQKTNYRIPGHPTLEQHHQRLGQVGEEKSLVDELMKRITTVDLEGAPISVPSMEFRILLAVLQRILRHFNIRLCDVVNMHEIVNSGQVDWDYLFSFARQQGLYRALTFYLQFVETIHRHYVGSELLPAQISRRVTKVTGPYTPLIERDYFRFSNWQVGPSVYAAKYVGYLRHLEFGPAMRLTLVPAFALFTFSNIKFFPRWPIWKRIW